ncbi:hypothetical protein HHI36_015619 [Cryptolaemus montrouzieri]
MKTNFSSNVSPNSVKSSSRFGECSMRSKSVENFREPSSTPYESLNGNFYFSPSSSESRKKELCNYLKLMNHADKKKVCLSRYRRSTRVKNLEQKELAKKQSAKSMSNTSSSLGENSDKSCEILRDKLSNIGESITLQSFDDLNMTIDTSKYLTLQEIEGKGKIFNFVMPPDDVLNEFNDFQHWIEPLIKKSSKLSKKLKRNGTFLNQNKNNRFNEKRSKYKNTNDENNSKLNNEPSQVKKQIIFDDDDNGGREIESGQRKRRSSNKSEVSLLCDGIKKCAVLMSEIRDAKISPPFDGDNNLNEEISGSTNGIVQTNVNIRVDYDISKSSVEKMQLDRESKISPKIKGLLDINKENYCRGFSREDIRKSQAIDTKVKKYYNMCCAFEHCQKNSVICNEISIENIVNNDLFEEDVSCKDSCKTVHPKNFNKINEEIDSESDTSSDSLSSIESEESSSTNSVHEKNQNDSLSEKCIIVNTSQISPRLKQVVPFNRNVEIQPLHNLLRKQNKATPNMNTMNVIQDWDSDYSNNGKNKSDISKGSSHFVSFDKENGDVQAAIYVDFFLILIQEFAVSLWNQTALGNVLGAQNLWIFNGCTKKLILNKECVRKKSLEMVISTDTCVAYVELWTKEHKSDIRQGPVADVFATVYFWIRKLNKMDRKVLQLENINGFADDVQYVVLKPSMNIVVSWHSVVENSKKTQIHVYTLAADFQTIVNVRGMEKVEHYVSSLHNIEDCMELLMGCGEHKITLWNIEHGYIVASIELSDIKLSLSTLWVKCDRGILFTVQQCVDRELRLIAINGRGHSWKKLKSYKPPAGFERIQNVYIENGVLISFYEEGILCWKAQTGEQILEEIHNETDAAYFPCGKYLITLTEKNVFIRHALTHLLTVDD